MGEYRFWLSAIPKNHQRVGKKMGRQKNGAAKRWDGKKMGRQKNGALSPGFHFFALKFFCPVPNFATEASSTAFTKTLG